MRRVILNMFVFFIILTGCSLTTPNSENVMAEFSKNTLPTGQYAYHALRNKGVFHFNYATYNGTRYWMWMDLREDDERKQTFIASVYAGGKNYMEFRRPSVDLIYHKNPNYNNKFIIDFGKPYETTSRILLKRYMLVEKIGLTTFRGRMIDCIVWDLDTTFKILDTSAFPTKVVANTRYDDVTTSGKTLSPPLLYGNSWLFDLLRTQGVVLLNYLTKNHVRYWMWLDFRIGVENEMTIAYHKPGISGSRFLSKRKIVNVLMNINNDNEFIIDLGKSNNGIGRYIYVTKTGSRFRGTVTDTPEWGMHTETDLTSSSIPTNTENSSDYGDVNTQGNFDYFEPGHMGENPHTYDEALAEAIRKVRGVDSFIRTSVSYDKPGAGSVIKTHRKEFYYQRRNNKIKNLKFIHTVEYNGRDGSSLFGKYFGERYTVDAESVERIGISDSFYYRISHRGESYSIEDLTKKGYSWYSIFPNGKSEILAVTNIYAGGDNIWRSIPHRIGVTSRYRSAFLIKKVSTKQVIIVDLFQSTLDDGSPEILVIESAFDFNNPPAQYIYNKQ